MNAAEQIGHDARVDAIRDGVAYISFIHSSGCAGCSIKSSCGMSESADKRIVVPVTNQRIEAGQVVTVYISPANGFKAVLWSYALPFVLVVLVLIVALGVGVAEPLAGIFALLSLAPYYGLLKLFSKSFRNDLSIEVQKR
jgi:positive regulator of sigma E activity